MAIVARFSMLIQTVTAPNNLGVSRPHIGGWSESFWEQQPGNINPVVVSNLLTARARLLPNEGQIIGTRTQLYDLQPTRLVPLGSTSAGVNYPGSSGLATDVPQIALMCTALSSAVNKRRFFIRGVPDAVVVKGEYDPSNSFQAAVNAYFAKIVSDGWFFIARDLSVPTYRVVAIASQTITVTGPHAIPIGGFVRLLRVRDVSGKTVKGLFRVTAVPDANNLTVDGLTGVVAKVSGAVRQDLLTIQGITSVNMGRAVVKKVGRPFEQYRGRRSKKTA